MRYRITAVAESMAPSSQRLASPETAHNVTAFFFGSSVRMPDIEGWVSRCVETRSTHTTCIRGWITVDSDRFLAHRPHPDSTYDVSV